LATVAHRTGKHRMKPKQTPEEYLSAYPPPMQELAQRLRALVRQVLPDATETVYPGWKLIGIRVPHGRTGAYVGFIQACSDHVHLGFKYGILVPDPKNLLQGKGTLVRYVTVRRGSEIRTRDFANLVRAARDISLNKNKHALLLLEQDARRHKK
jgi:hypothetical protein